jgi:hypothetical protein
MCNTGREITFDDMLDALSDVQRRNVLLALIEREPAADSPVAIRMDEFDTRTRLRMDHLHLPKLSEYGFVEWDESTRELRAGPNLEEIRPLFELLRRNEEILPDDWVETGFVGDDGASETT